MMRRVYGEEDVFQEHLQGERVEADAYMCSTSLHSVNVEAAGSSSAQGSMTNPRRPSHVHPRQTGNARFTRAGLLSCLCSHHAHAPSFFGQTEKSCVSGSSRYSVLRSGTIGGTDEAQKDSPAPAQCECGAVDVHSTCTRAAGTSVGSVHVIIAGRTRNLQRAVNRTETHRGDSQSPSEDWRGWSRIWTVLVTSTNMQQRPHAIARCLRQDNIQSARWACRISRSVTRSCL